MRRRTIVVRLSFGRGFIVMRCGRLIVGRRGCIAKSIEQRRIRNEITNVVHRCEPHRFSGLQGRQDHLPRVNFEDRPLEFIAKAQRQRRKRRGAAARELERDPIIVVDAKPLE